MIKHIAFLIFCTFPLWAKNPWYDQKLEGWYYFEDPLHQERKKDYTPEEAEQAIAVEKRKLHQLLSLALLNPTKENLEKYMKEQQRWIHQSELFARTWGRVLLTTPFLSSLLETPTSSYGILAKKGMQTELKKQLLQRLSKRHFLLFFFQGKDPFSEKAAEVVKLFQNINHWEVKGVSLDGVCIKEFPQFEKDQGISKLIGVKAAPSYFVVNPYENTIVPVGVGLITVNEIEQNIEEQFREKKDD